MKIQPDVPLVYDDKFPGDFVNGVNGWYVSKKELEEQKGKVLTLDIDFGNYCSLNCPHCFRKNNRVDFGDKKLMAYDDIIDIIKQGKKLGLKSVKFLGAGEPFENIRFLEFLRELKRMNVIPVIFTKGHVLGDVNLVKKWYSIYGITNGEGLAEELNRVNASILLGFNSFYTEIQDRMVGNAAGYSLKRNKALEILVSTGFNRHNPTRLCIAANPITNDNYKEMFDIYKWSRARNLYPIVCPAMISGRCGEEKAWYKITPSRVKLIELYVKIYRFNIEKGMQTIRQIEEEGVSSYAGGHPCNQLACGMYVTLTGTVLRCPGDDVTVFGNIWDQSLEDIWLKSENYKRAGTFNSGCPPKQGKSIPNNFYADVLSRLKER